MYDNYYDDYMRNVLGYEGIYNMMPQDLYNTNTYLSNDMFESQMIGEDIEDCYPEIYKIIYPMIQKACINNTKPISRKLIDDIVENIYYNIEPNESINVNVNIGNSSKINSYSSDRDTKSISPSRNTEVKSEIREVKGDTRTKETRQKNYLLNDLIRILVLRELIGRPNNSYEHYYHQRPPIRPPYQGPAVIPPLRPRGDYRF